LISTSPTSKRGRNENKTRREIARDLKKNAVFIEETIDPHWCQSKKKVRVDATFCVSGVFERECCPFPLATAALGAKTVDACCRVGGAHGSGMGANTVVPATGLTLFFSDHRVRAGEVHFDLGTHLILASGDG